METPQQVLQFIEEKPSTMYSPEAEKRSADASKKFFEGLHDGAISTVYGGSNNLLKGVASIGNILLKSPLYQAQAGLNLYDYLNSSIVGKTTNTKPIRNNISNYLDNIDNVRDSVYGFANNNLKQVDNWLINPNNSGLQASRNLGAIGLGTAATAPFMGPLLKNQAIQNASVVAPRLAKIPVIGSRIADIVTKHPLLYALAEQGAIWGPMAYDKSFGATTKMKNTSGGTVRALLPWSIGMWNPVNALVAPTLINAAQIPANIAGNIAYAQGNAHRRLGDTELGASKVVVDTIDQMYPGVATAYKNGDFASILKQMKHSKASSLPLKKIDFRQLPKIPDTLLTRFVGFKPTLRTPGAIIYDLAAKGATNGTGGLDMDYIKQIQKGIQRAVATQNPNAIPNYIGDQGMRYLDLIRLLKNNAQNGGPTEWGP